MVVVARLPFALRAGRDGHVEARGGQLHRRGLADASAGAGDESDACTHECVSIAVVSDDIQPFTIDVPDDVLDDLRDRLARTRFSAQIDGAGWDYGTERGYLQELCRYWREDYDWRGAEAELNRFAQFTTTVDGQRIHFVHVRSPETDALPLVLIHGWPGSIAEFTKVIGPLSDPAGHGGDAADAFHVVCPALPGYGFSGPTNDRGWDTRRIASAFSTLMERLGYERYGAQGGDWGSMVSTQLAVVDPGHVCGIHINLVIAGPPEGDDLSTLTESQLAALGDVDRYLKQGMGYAQIQGTRPQTIGYPLDDSPAGLAAWIVEKFRAWSDCDGDIERSFTKDELLTNLMFYWVTATAHSAGRLYYEAMQSGRFGLSSDPRIEVPTGCAIFPREIARPPRRWAETRYNVTHWTEMPAGGHFAAMEEPQLLVDDVRTFFRTLR
jgi:microsomal epoxide hydrolase